MARIRSIKPEFFVSEQIADVSPTCRLLFIGMWLFCDDAGIHPASPRQLKMEVFPGDDITTKQVAALVGELLRVGLLVEYEADDKVFWQVTGWHHQKIERPRCQYPKPESSTPHRQIADESSTPHRQIADTSLPTRARGTGPDRTGDDPTGPELSSSNARRPTWEAADMECAEWMFQKILDNVSPSAKPPSLPAWANEIRLMRERDKRADVDIRAVFAWANLDSFWRANVLCPKSLRSRFDQLRAKMSSDNGNAQRRDPLASFLGGKQEC